MHIHMFWSLFYAGRAPPLIAWYGLSMFPCPQALPNTHPHTTARSISRNLQPARPQDSRAWGQHHHPGERGGRGTANDKHVPREGWPAESAPYITLSLSPSLSLSFVCVYIYTHRYMYTYIYTDIHMYTHISIYIYNTYII